MGTLGPRESIEVLYNRRLDSRFGILFTYREGLNYRFPRPTNFKRRRLFNLFRPYTLSQDLITVDSDKGWGCVIRSTQMALAQALINLVLGPEFQIEDLKPSAKSPRNRHPGKDLTFARFKKLVSEGLDADDLTKVLLIISQFKDDTASLFSIYNFVIADIVLKTCTKFLHFGPTSSALCISKIINDANMALTSIAFPDGVFYINKVKESLERNKNLLVWVSLKKKLDKFERECVRSLFRLSQFNGIVGGNLLNRSFYIFGTSPKRLYYNDPHIYCQKAFTDLENVDIVRDFTSKRVKSMNWRYLNASFTLLFLFKGREDFNRFLVDTFEKESMLESFPFEFVTDPDLTFN